MAAGDLITTDWEIEYRGLVMGGDNAISLVSVDGLLGARSVTSSDQPRLRRHGLRAGDDFLAGRTVVIRLEVKGSSDADLGATLAALTAAFRPGVDEAPLVFQLPPVAGGAKARIGARTRPTNIPVDLQALYLLPEVEIELFATDPKVYANDLSTASTTLPTAGGGLTFNATPDFTFGATSTGGSFVANNAGGFPTPVTFRIDGPVQEPRIINQTQDRELKLGLTVADGDHVLVDSDTRTVLLNGTASRYSDLTSSEWFDLDPGDNDIAFFGATTAAGTLSASWRSAWT